MDPDLESDLLGIQLSGSDDEVNDAEPAEGNAPKKSDTSASAGRTAQSEEEFQAVRKEYRVKVENGEIWKTINLPLGPGRVPKHEAQALLHAVEELYFFRRYAEGAQFARTALGGDGDGGGEHGAPQLDNDTRRLLQYYEKKCTEKAEKN